MNNNGGKVLKPLLIEFSLYEALFLKEKFCD